MKPICRITSLLLLLCIAASCTHIPPALTRADAIMEQDPDSALAVLSEVDTSALRSSRARALYGLLLTQAQVKCDIPIASDSLISASARYFSHNGPDSLTMRALFYKGYVNYLSGNYTESIVPASDAYDMAIQQADNYWIAKSAELLSFLYASTYYFDESLKHSQISAKYYYKAGRKLNHLYALCDIGLTLANMGKHEEANRLLDSVYNVSFKDTRDTLLASCALGNKFASKIYAKDFKSALFLADSLKKLNYSFSNQELGWLAKANLMAGNPIDIAPFLKCSSDKNLLFDESASLYGFLSNYYLQTGNPWLAINYVDTLLSIRNHKVGELIKQSLITTLNNANIEKKNQERNKSARLSQAVIFIGVFSCAAIAMILILWYYRNKLKDAELQIVAREIAQLNRTNQQLIHHSSCLQDALTIKQNALDSSKDEIIKLNLRVNRNIQINTNLYDQVQLLFRNQWTIINNLCDTFFESESGAEQRNLLKKINQELNFITDKKNLKKLEQSINRYNNNICERLRSQCPWISDEDYKFILLISSGFSPRAVCYFCKIKLKYYYNKKYRLAERIEKAAPSDKEDFVAMFR